MSPPFLPQIEIRDQDAVPGLLPMARGRFLTRTVIRARSNLFDRPVLLTSDLHKDTHTVVEWLDGVIDPRAWEFIACGDMAGTDRMGEDASPLGAYLEILGRYQRLHHVLGNHDSESQELLDLENDDGTPCLVDLASREVGGRRVVGHSGIFGNPRKPGRYPPAAFQRFLETLRLEDGPGQVLLTHETPRMEGFRPHIGQDGLTQWVRDLSPVAHVFGHCHLEPVSLSLGSTLFLNVDARVLLLGPAEPS